MIEGRMPPVDPLAVQLSPEECVLLGTVEESRKEVDKAAILAALSDEGQTANDLAQMIDRPASSVRKILDSLYAAEQITRDGEGKRGDPYLYSKINCAQKIPLREETQVNGDRVSELVGEALTVFSGGRIVRRTGA